MSRTVINIKCDDLQNANMVAENILTANKYQKISENSETVWKSGMGLLTAIKYIKIEFTDGNTMSISGWIRPMASGEQDLTGAFAAMPKKQVMNVIRKIQSSI